MSDLKRFDCVVLGAGMAGLGAALHLQARGRSTALVDRRGPAEETSFGNAGLIQAEAVTPYACPRDWRVVANALLGRATEARIVWRDLPATAGWLLAYWREGSAARIERTARAAAPLIERAVAEHEALAEAAGVAASLRRDGYLVLTRRSDRLAALEAASRRTRDAFGIPFELWDAARVAEAEPHLQTPLAGAIHYPTPVSHPDPNALGRAYAALFERRGGVALRGDAQSLRSDAGLWRVETRNGPVAARDAVVALGPWSGDALRAQGVATPLGVKRGYHMHFAATGNAALSRLVVDDDHGYVLTPMARGVRLTTGAEFARRDRPPSPVQLRRVEPIARRLFPLAERRDPTAWMGSRPCLPDLLPMVGPVPGRPGLWAHFGHQHHGFTLGPTTGRLLAEMIVGETPFTDPTPYRVDRF